MPYSKIERWGATASHASLLLVGLPISLLTLLSPSWSILLSPPLFLLFCPVLPYLIGRSFRRRGMSWGAYQGMQASVMQLMILILAVFYFLTTGIPKLSESFFILVLLLALYSLWGALDTWLGYDFQYKGISHLLEHVSQRNMGRQEVRRRWFGSGGLEGEDKRK